MDAVYAQAIEQRYRFFRMGQFRCCAGVGASAAQSHFEPYHCRVPPKAASPSPHHAT